MGTYERDAWIPIPSQCMDTARSAIFLVRQQLTDSEFRCYIIHHVGCPASTTNGRLVHSLSLLETLPQSRRSRHRWAKFTYGYEAAGKSPGSNDVLLAPNVISLNQLLRQILDASVQWAMKGDKTGFWRGQRKTNKTESPRESVISLRKGNSSIAKLKSEE